MEITLEFAGGLEQLVKGEKKSITVSFSEKSERIRLFHVVSFVAHHVISAKPELFATAYTPQDAEVYRQLEEDQRVGISAESSSINEGLNGGNGIKKVYSTKELLQGCMTVRGGVLCLINETDIEVLKGQETEIKDKDVITFISTLHGG